MLEFLFAQLDVAFLGGLGQRIGNGDAGLLLRSTNFVGV
jgi:hypothetical protein